MGPQPHLLSSRWGFGVCAPAVRVARRNARRDGTRDATERVARRNAWSRGVRAKGLRAVAACRERLGGRAEAGMRVASGLRGVRVVGACRGRLGARGSGGAWWEGRTG